MANTPTGKKEPRVLDQIEAAADFYGPDVYAQALTFYSNFTNSPDFLSQGFIPVSQTRANPKLFVVGLIPPTANISGKLLDRFGSVAAIVGAPVDVTLSQAGGGSGGRAGGSGGGGPLQPVVGGGSSGSGQRLDVKKTPVSQQAFAEALLRILPTATKEQAGVLWAQFAGETGSGSSCFGWNLGNVKHSQGSNSDYQALSKVWEGVSPKQAQTLIEGGLWVADPDPSHATAVGPNKVSVLVTPGREADNPACFFVAYPNLDAAMASFINSKKNGRYASSWGFIENGDPDGYARELGKLGYYTASPDAYSTALQAHYAKWANDSSFERAQQKAGISTEAAASKWQEQGSANAAQAKADDSKSQDNGLRDKQSALGARFLSAQAAEIRATAAAIDAMRATPPLRLLVNPNSFKVSSEKVVADGEWTRNGPIIEHWGDGQDTIEGSGKLAGFFAIDADSPKEDAEVGGPGLTRVARNFSASYHNLLSLWLLYRNNASILTQGLDGSEWARLSMLGSIYIYYDNTLYIGSFNNFNLTENDSAPYTLEYNFQFTVRATFLLDRPDEYDYGAKKIFQGDPTIPSKGQIQAEEDLRLQNEAAIQKKALDEQAATQAEYGIAAAKHDAESGFMSPPPLPVSTLPTKA